MIFGIFNTETASKWSGQVDLQSLVKCGWLFGKVNENTQWRKFKQIFGIVWEAADERNGMTSQFEDSVEKSNFFG